MATYYLQEQGIVTGATVQIDGDHEHPANAFIPNDDERADIVRWLDAGRMVFWTEKRGAHLDETREEAARPQPETPVAPTPPVPEPLPPHPSETHYIAVIDAFVEYMNPQTTDARKRELFNIASSAVTKAKAARAE